MVWTFDKILKVTLNRRILLRSGVVGLLSQLIIPAARAVEALTQQASFKSEVVAELDLPAVNLNNWSVTVLDLTFPGSAPLFPSHQHSGFVIGYVRKGEFRFQLRGEPETIIKAGQIFFEPPGSIHEIGSSASATKPAKVLVLLFGEKGKENTTLV